VNVLVVVVKRDVVKPHLPSSVSHDPVRLSGHLEIYTKINQLAGVLSAVGHRVTCG